MTLGNIRPPVRAPDEAFSLLILALMVLSAPLASLSVAQDMRDELREMTQTLLVMGEAQGSPVGVPISSNDEVGDLAAELNANCLRFEEEHRLLAIDLEAASSGERARTRFLSAASHELRSPLTLITSCCHQLKEGPLNSAQQEDLELISQAGQQLLTHVDEILKLSQMEASVKQPLERSLVDLKALIEDLLKAQSPPPEISLDFIAPERLPLISLDPRRIRHILENLLSNALKFTHEGYIQLSLDLDRLEEREALHLQIIDSGVGIPAGEQKQIFQEFYRVERQREVIGTGLGLAIAKRWVERHEGRIWVESILGEGSCFHLLLPLQPREARR